MEKVFKWKNIEVSNTPSSDYQSWQKETNSYFDGERWGQVLHKGFNTERYYLWDSKNKTGLSLTIFKKGPFRMGFLGFPACVMHWEGEEPYRLDEMLEAVKHMPHKPHLIRITPSQFANINLANCKGKKSITIETCLNNLQGWNSENSQKIKKDWNRALKKCKSLSVERFIKSHLMYQLYFSAVVKNNGSEKYNLSYFEALQEEINHLVVSSRHIDEGQIKSMVISTSHGKGFYYLHAGSTPEAMKIGASDFLMKQVIDEAKERGFEAFNFLSSPENQHGLIKFKEKWGGESKELITYTIPTGLIGKLLLVIMSIVG
ncbi:hypothetical protein DSM16313_06770 [Acinetobacter seohaensis]|nr:hypothetical protein DSM16313_06770 [Acinetobacter seohaensis]